MNANRTLKSMDKNRFGKAPHNVHLDPESRICPEFDSVSIARFPVAVRQEMGFRVLDNCCEDHTQ